MPHAPDPHIVVPASSAEVLMYAVKRLDTFGQGDARWIGTGYACCIPAHGDRVIKAFVTNKHVVENASRFEIHFHTGVPDPALGIRPNGGSAIVSLTPQNSRLIPHPSGLDLAAILIGELIETWRGEDPELRLFTTYINPDDLWDEGLSPQLDVSEPVMMIGCPNALWDDVHKFPLFRRGHTATHPAIDFRGRPEFAVDIAAFPGSSGSPVFLWGFGGDRTTKPVTDQVLRFGLIGTLYGGPPPMVNEGAASYLHLGYAIKARETLSLFDEIRKFVG